MPDSGRPLGPAGHTTGASMGATFRRPWHRLVGRVLASLNRELLASARCYFGGGTRDTRTLARGLRVLRALL